MFKLLLCFAEMDLGDAALISLIGIALIIAVLAVLMLFIKLMSLVIDSGNKKEVKEQPKQNEQAPQEADRGSVKLINCSDRDAAMIMAIVADCSGIELNKLHFNSIKLIGEEK